MASNNASILSFRHEPLQGPNTIRLLCVRPQPSGSGNKRGKSKNFGSDAISYELIEVPLDACTDSYQAVSYAWGEDIKDHHILIEGHYALSVTKSLAIALPYLVRSCSTGCLWIDQICIDQSNIPEREQQVSIMGNVYTNALQVLIWTGGEIRGLDKVLERAQAPFEPFWLKRNEMKPVFKLLSRLWFTRGWVIQEAVMAKEALVMAGSYVFNILDLVAAWCTQGPRLHKAAEVQIADATLAMIINLRQDYVGKFGSGFDGLLNGCGDAHIKDPRDHVYAFLGLNPDPRITIVPQYDVSVTEVFTNTARAMIEGTQSLAHFRLLPSSNISDGTKLPSWVPNWSKKHEMSVILSQIHQCTGFKAACHRKHRTGISHSPNSNILHVSGRIVDEVQQKLRNPIFSFVKAFFDSRRLPQVYTTRTDVVLNKFRRKAHQLPLFFNWTTDQVQAIDSAALMDPSQTLRHRLASAFSGGRWDSSELLAHYDGLTDWTTSSEHPKLWSSANEIFPQLCTYQLWHTVGGKFALLPPVAEGDHSLIAILHGSDAPVVLSKETGNTYTVGGYCYLEDAMYGDACTWDEDDADALELS